MQLNTLAGRSYNDISQVNLVLVRMLFLIFVVYLDLFCISL